MKSIRKNGTKSPTQETPDAETRLQREIGATDRAIDQLVYQLYDLTPEEIALVESATAPATQNDITEDNDVSTPVTPEMLN